MGKVTKEMSKIASLTLHKLMQQKGEILRKQPIKQPNKRTMEIHCHKKGKYVVRCRPDKRKVKSIFPKWWCFYCKRYVLPDNFHKLVFFEEEVN